jgi:predicted ester cyclase
MVVFDFEMTATHSGPLLGVPATGNRVEMTNAALFRIADGRIVEEWPRTDMLALMEGIGVVELPF